MSAMWVLLQPRIIFFCLFLFVSSDLQMNGRALDSTAARSSEQQYTVDATAASNNIPSPFVKRLVFACAWECCGFYRSPILQVNSLAFESESDCSSSTASDDDINNLHVAIGDRARLHTVCPQCYQRRSQLCAGGSAGVSKTMLAAL